ncbi:MAG TPA: cell division topological specificity factor MinE [Clostridiales bacterium]|nr:cell division topological specificity factor MinE [Clostridiales bacterium]
MDLFRFFSKDDTASKNIAKERLKLLLVHDRTNVSPQFLNMVKADIIKVVSDYIEIDHSGLEVRLGRHRKSDDTIVSTLTANIPIKRMKKIGKNTYK